MLRYDNGLRNKLQILLKYIAQQVIISKVSVLSAVQYIDDKLSLSTQCNENARL